jgi:hypothetical protein
MAFAGSDLGEAPSKTDQNGTGLMEVPMISGLGTVINPDHPKPLSAWL